MSFNQDDWLCINTLRTLSIDAIQKANSGHPGLPLGAAPMAYVLWDRHLKFDPSATDWADRDRFVLSGGHGSALYYSLLHMYGYELGMDELKNFRQWDSKTPGHPEAFLTPGVEATTGPLGQGCANAVGMAMAERHLAHRFNKKHKLINHYTYALVTDGDIMEGLSHEAASLAGHLKLGKLIYLYDANDISLDGPLDITFTENVAKRYEACGWQVITVADGDKDLVAIDQAISDARSELHKPSMIIVKTTIGFGSPNKQGTSSAHGSPLGPDELALTKKSLEWDPEKSFHVPEKVKAHCAAHREESASVRIGWQGVESAFKKDEPEAYAEWQAAFAGDLPAAWDSDMPTWKSGEALATRSAAGTVMNLLAKRCPTLWGGDADLSCSTNTSIKDGGSFEGQRGSGRNVHFGVREHVMAAIANGILYHGGSRPYVATFFCFSDYMRPSVRLAALNHLPAIFVWTHDSIGLGEDGPTHQPVEQLMSLRAMPNLWMYRPADANETAHAWRCAMARKDGPSGLVFSRQKLPVIEGSALKSKEGVERGAYVLCDAKEPKALIMATGSEIHLAVEAHKELADAGIATRVVSMPCWEAYECQPDSYHEELMPSSISARVAIEAGVTLGWERWVGRKGAIIGVDRFGASAPAPKLMQEYGITKEAVIAAVKAQISS